MRTPGALARGGACLVRAQARKMGETWLCANHALMEAPAVAVG